MKSSQLPNLSSHKPSFCAGSRCRWWRAWPCRSAASRRPSSRWCAQNIDPTRTELNLKMDNTFEYAVKPV